MSSGGNSVVVSSFDVREKVVLPVPFIRAGEPFIPFTFPVVGLKSWIIRIISNKSVGSSIYHKVNTVCIGNKYDRVSF